tara:strand:+ start:5406 stop:5651 length:246 start_codon:yes stop_codon:yes gene_type:complete
MITKRLSRGHYNIIDAGSNQYRVVDVRRNLPDYPVGEVEEGENWGIYEQQEGRWMFIAGRNTLKDSLLMIETWHAASQIGR